MPKTKLLVVCPPGQPVLRLLDSLSEVSDVSVSNEQSELETLAAEAEVILFTGVSAAALNLPQLWQHSRSVRWIHSLNTGVEKLLSPALTAGDIQLTNARGVSKRALAEFAMLGILFHTKKVRRLIDNQREHKWDGFTVNYANQLVLGVVGFGEIGRECALLAKGLGLEVHALRRHPQQTAADPLIDRTFSPTELPQMLGGIDVLLCAAPLTEQTRHMIGDAEFKAMKPTALVINVGRGPVIDEAALVRALQTGHIAGASLDVFEHEPLPESSPLWGMDNVLISPHCTDRTVNPDYLEVSMQIFIENFHRYRNGEPLRNIVDKQAGY